jgi:Uma2 family endonuclease
MGVGTRVPLSPNSLPQPDLQVKQGPPTDRSVTGDSLVLFEVLSRSNTRADQAWRRRVYASVPNCQHYVTVAQGKVEVTRYDRADGWSGTTLTGLGDKLNLLALGVGVAIPLAEIYRWTPLGEPTA